MKSFKFLHSLRIKLYYFRKEMRYRILLYKLRIYYKQLNSKADHELVKALEFYLNNGIEFFPYSFLSKYRVLDIPIHYKDGFPYVDYKGHHLFLKSTWNNETIKKYTIDLLCEQDYDSPHRYEEDDFCVTPNDIVIDIGAAEGNFSLTVADIAMKVYLFEIDKLWSPVLKKTFQKYSDKVIFVDKKISNYDSETTICPSNIPELYKHPLFIKIDVDGNEVEVLNGLETLLRNHSNIKIALCTYHKQNDAAKFELYMKKLGFFTQFSKGYMLFYHDRKIKKPYLRKAVLRCKK